MNQFFDGLTDKTQNLFTPVSKINKLVLDNVSQLIDIQSKSLSAYTELGLDQAKAAMEIRDTESFTAFINQQSEMAENVHAQFKGDIEKISELASKAKNEITGAFSEEESAE